MNANNIHNGCSYRGNSIHDLSITVMNTDTFVRITIEYIHMQARLNGQSAIE